MPIWLRKFTFEKIKKHFEEQKEAIDKQNKILNPDKDFNKVAKPNITPKPTYTAKSPKK